MIALMILRADGAAGSTPTAACFARATLLSSTVFRPEASECAAWGLPTVAWVCCRARIDFQLYAAVFNVLVAGGPVAPATSPPFPLPEISHLNTHGMLRFQTVPPSNRSRGASVKRR